MTDDRTPESAWSRFWFAPIPTTGFQVLRILSGCLFLFWLLSLLGHQESFFSLRGFVDVSSLQEARRPENAGTLPPVGWSFLYLAGESKAVFQGMYWFSILILLLYTLGVATRVTAVLTWVIVVSFLANPISSYEGDYLLVILAFHLMLGHCLLGLDPVLGLLFLAASCVAAILVYLGLVFVGPWLRISPFIFVPVVVILYLLVIGTLCMLPWKDGLSIPERLLGSRRDFIFWRWIWGPQQYDRPPSFAANWSLRLLQIHVAIILVTTGLHKLQIDDWWAGAALWYPLHPTFVTTIEMMEREKASAPMKMFFLSFLNYVVLVWEIGFPTFAWRHGKIARTLLIGGGLIAWAGNAFLFRAPLFGPFYFIGCLSFLSADEWTALKARVLGRFSRSPAVTPAREPVKSTAFTASKK